MVGQYTTGTSLYLMFYGQNPQIVSWTVSFRWLAVSTIIPEIYVHGAANTTNSRLKECEYPKTRLRCLHPPIPFEHRSSSCLMSLLDARERFVNKYETLMQLDMSPQNSARIDRLNDARPEYQEEHYDLHKRLQIPRAPKREDK